MRVRWVRDNGRYRDTVERLLVDADTTFVPPLTSVARDGISRSGDETGRASIEGYVDRCLRRPLIGAFVDGSLVGFASVQPIDESAPLDGYTPANHVSILIVAEPYRNRGIATAVYRQLLTDPPDAHRRPYVSTKTWSTNHAHVAVLDKLGFERVDRIRDDRGEAIDTVYYAAPARH